MPDSQPPDDPIVRLQEIRAQKQPRHAAPNSPPKFSDDAVALTFAQSHAGTLRHVAAWGKWLIWRGSHWETDDTLLVFDLARVICRAISSHAETDNLAAAIASAKTVAAVVNLSRSDRRIAETVDVWDCDQGLLNTPKRTIALPPGRENDERDPLQAP